ncbi:MAG: UbiA family prenyltransferase [Elusimicrobiota bacterium]
MSAVIRLTKLPICALCALAGAAAHIMAAGGLRSGAAAVFAGIMLAACGACALNQWQERSTDALMERTRRRPLPSGQLKPQSALALSNLLSASGLFILYAAAGPLPAALCLGSALWYNAVYTPLKKRTAFAVVPGALIGALVPAAGWAAAGGGLLDARLLSFSFFIFMWQVPHFWLLGLIYADDYERAGFPTTRGLFGEERAARLIFVWAAATAMSGLLLPLFGSVRTVPAAVLLIAAAALTFARAARLASVRADIRSLRAGRTAMNAQMAMVVLALLIEGVPGTPL